MAKNKNDFMKDLSQAIEEYGNTLDGENYVIVWEDSEGKIIVEESSHTDVAELIIQRLFDDDENIIVIVRGSVAYFEAVERTYIKMLPKK